MPSMHIKAFSYSHSMSERVVGDLTTDHEHDKETGYDCRGARFYDSDLARFLSTDPLASDYASWSPYNYVMGNPIRFIDPDGRFVVNPNASRKQRRTIRKAIRGLRRRSRDEGVKAAFAEYGQFGEKMLKADLKNGQGPTIKLVSSEELDGAKGEFSPRVGSKEIRLNEDIVNGAV